MYLPLTRSPFPTYSVGCPGLTLDLTWLGTRAELATGYHPGFSQSHAKATPTPWLERGLLTGSTVTPPPKKTQMQCLGQTSPQGLKSLHRACRGRGRKCPVRKLIFELGNDFQGAQVTFPHCSRVAPLPMRRREGNGPGQGPTRHQIHTNSPLPFTGFPGTFVGGGGGGSSQPGWWWRARQPSGNQEGDQLPIVVGTCCLLEAHVDFRNAQLL